MEIQIQWFGLSWVAAVSIAIAAAVFLVKTARRLADQGRPTGLLKIAALLEVAVLVLDLIIRFGASKMHPEGFGAVDWGLRMLDAWTLCRPLAHAVVLVLLAKGLQSMAKTDPAT